MKRLIYIFLILFGFTSCMKEDSVKMEPGAKDKVDIVFSVNMPEPTFGTKAMGDTPEVENMYVAVFGSSGFLKEYVKATIAPSQLATQNNTRYDYKVSLSLTESTVKVHFIANGPTSLPFRNEDEVMASLMKNGTDDAYWQRIVVPGIRPKKDADGNYLDEAGNIINIDDPESTPVVSPETKAYFADIPLVRNFARIKVEAKPGIGFTVNGFVLINTPKSGSIAPYNKSTGAFVENYQSKSYDDLFGVYPGNLPITAEIDDADPTEDKTKYTQDNKYMYERPIPTSKPTKVIVLGTYNGQQYFYKVDLMDDTGYYPIYRNFEYKITITQVVRAGFSTAKEAAESAGSGDVSTIQEATNLTDVSDGTARIYVEYTEKTIVGGNKTVTLKYKFIPNVSTGVVNNGAVTITKSDSDDSPCDGDVIGSATDWNPNSTGGEDADGFRTLSFKTQPTPESGIKTQEIKVTGTYNGGDSKLYRIVSYKLMGKMDLEVECVPNEVPRTKGSELDVVIKLPRDLPNSMFPLQLKIEADKLSITPNNDNLPVQPGTSIVQGSSAASYQFIKTISRAEYDALTPAEGKVPVACHFKTSKDNSAGSADTDVCKVYVDNIDDTDHAYFNKAYGTFTNYTLRHFSNLSLTPLDEDQIDQPVTLKFNLENHTPLPDVYITVKGLKKQPGDTQLQEVSSTAEGITYKYSPGSSSTFSRTLLTSDYSGVYSVSLSAYHYEDASLANLNYIDPGFTGTQVPWGIGKDVEFKFKYQGTVDDPIQEDVLFTLTNLKPADNDTRFEQVRDGRWRFRPASGSGLEQTINFKTVKLAANVSVSMKGDSYNPAGPFNLSCPELTYNNPRITTNPIPWGINNDVEFKFSYRGTASAPIHEDVVFTLTDVTPSEGDNRFSEIGGGKWLFTPLTTSGIDQTITFKTTKFGASIKVEMSGDSYKPATVEKAAPTFSVASQSLRFTGNNHPDRDNVTVYTKTGESVGTFYVARGGYYGSYYYYNNAAFDIDLTKFSENEEVYMSYSYGGTYYTSSTVTLSQLANATSTSNFTITTNWTTTRPW